MALLKKSLVDEQVRESFSALTDLSFKYNVESMKNELNQQIENLKKQEQIFLDAVNASNVQVVNQRVQQYKQDYPKIKNLSGPALYKEFLKSIEASQAYLEDQKQKEFVDFFSRVQVFQTGGKKSERGLIDPNKEFAKWFQAILNSVDLGTKGGIHQTAAYKNETEIKNVLLKRLTFQQQERVKEFMKGRARKQDSKYEIVISQESDSVKVTFSSQDWAKLTDAQKASQIQDQLKRGTLTQEWLNGVLEKIYNLIISKGPSNNIHFINAVKEVVFDPDTKTKVFYGGNMLNGITGLLGEIQGLFFIKSLLGEANNTEGAVEWVGGKGNPHEDLILQSLGKMVGIQVKNSYKDVEKIGKMEDISFMSRAAWSFDSVVKRIGAADYQDILSIYEMEAFNIEYLIEDGIYKKGDNDAFKPTRDNIVFLAREADRIMALFAGALMYMAVGEEFTDIETGNSVYVLGGATLKLASEILVSLFKKLENYEKDIGFKISAHFEKGASQVGNIVDYFNSNKASRGNSVSKALGNLFLTSSFTFDL